MREMTAIVCRIITVCLLLFFPDSDGGARQRQSQGFAVEPPGDAVSVGRLDGVRHCLLLVLDDQQKLLFSCARVC